MLKLLAALALLAGTGALAQTVSLQGLMGNRALLIVDGSAPKMVAAGDSFQGVKVVSASGDQAVVEIKGERRTLRIGDAPASVGAVTTAPGRGSRIVMAVGSGGHFITEGAINGQAVRFMVDTGATAVAMGASEAQRIGLDYKAGKLSSATTANGVVTMWLVKLGAVRIGDVEIRDVDAAVVPMSMPYILLGNSFLGRFQMKRENDLMVLERRY